VLVSLSRFLSILVLHHMALEVGQVACVGQPCQKQPSMKMATFSLEKAMSMLRRGKPGTGTARRNRKPSAWRRRRIASSG
jgi:hypothetical protein